MLSIFSNVGMKPIKNLSFHHLEEGKKKNDAAKSSYLSMKIRQKYTKNEL